MSGQIFYILKMSGILASNIETIKKKSLADEGRK
jgi:hypothetical protein